MKGALRRSAMAEAAVVLPVVLLVLMLSINATLAGYTAVSAQSAANYGARVGAVSQRNAEQQALDAVETHLHNARGPGEYSAGVMAVNEPGGTVMVVVTWKSPTMLSGLCSLFGRSCPENFSGQAVSLWKKEGWRSGN